MEDTRNYEQKFYILSSVHTSQVEGVLKGLRAWFPDANVDAESKYTGNWDIYTKVKVSYRKLEEMTKFAQGICYGCGYTKEQLSK